MLPVVFKHSKKALPALVAVLIVGASFLGGILFGYHNRPAVEKVINITSQQTPQNLQEVDFDIFWDVWSRIEDKYVDKEKLNRQDLVYGAITGLVKSLKDPNSEFLPPKQSQQFNDDIKGAFDGIGAEIGIRKGVLTIIAPLKNSPAERAGVKAGDKIIKVDDTPTLDVALDEAVRLIRGPKGTEVKLTVLRDSLEKAKEFKIIRDTIKIQVLTTEKKPNGIFVIKLHHFTQTSLSEFRTAVQEFYQTDSRKLVLDLRNNPGGFLGVSIDIASWFLPTGEVVARERFADGSEEIYRSSGYKLLEKVPLVVLVNEGSASASEIVAGALRDVRGIKLIGTKTFGKGSVQEVQPLPNRSSLKLTIAKWVTPKGVEINGTGLEPDVKVEIPEDKELGPDEDPILEKGIEILKEL